ncbi:hypothetical protein Taro_048908, partial [Colocasia esculenta]|nr:hypothetical protein [Colocasia esculenta]
SEPRRRRCEPRIAVPSTVGPSTPTPSPTLRRVTPFSRPLLLLLLLLFFFFAPHLWRPLCSAKPRPLLLPRLDCPRTLPGKSSVSAGEGGGADGPQAPLPVPPPLQQLPSPRRLHIL